MKAAVQVEKASELVRAYAAFILRLINRDTSEGATLDALVMVRKDLMEDGVAMHRFISNRGKAETTIV